MIFSGTTRLQDGTRVRVRMPQTSDREALRDLHARLGLATRDLDLHRVIRFDPKTRVVVVALAWVDGGVRIAGYAGASRDDTDVPDLLVCDELLAPGVAELLERALRDRSRLPRVAA